MIDAKVLLLGPVDVEREGEPRTVTGLRRKATLALLALSPDAVVSADRLIDVVWNGSAPATALNTLQRNISYLRTVLADRAAIVARPPGYQLNRVTTDAQVAQRLIDDAERMTDPRSRAGRLSTALTLWRGPALADVSVLPGLEPEAGLLEALRQRALRARFDAWLDAGEHERLFPELPRLAAEHPWDERLHRQLILAYYRTGQQAKALETARRIRERLRAELGVDAGPELVALELAVLRHDVDRITSAQIVTGRSANRPASRLPDPEPAFVGRSGELTALDGIVARATRDGTPAVAVVVGGAGVGKTTLVVHWAHRAAAGFPDGQLHLNLHGFGAPGAPLDPEEAALALIAGLGVPVPRIPAGLAARTALLRSLLADKRALLVLDNARDSDQVRPLLVGGPGCLIVVTSRHQLTPLMTETGAQPLTVDRFDAPEAYELLARRIGVDRAEADTAAVYEIIARCARLPLALGIAAARAAAHPRRPLSELAAELGTGGAVLDMPAGNQDVRRVLSWSYASLSPAAARLLRLLGLHPGPDIGVAAAASLAGVSVEEATQLLAELRRANLVTGDDNDRHALHDVLRAYARELAVGTDTDADRRAAVRRLLDHYLHTAQLASRRLHGMWSDLPLPPLDPQVTVGTLRDAAETNTWLDREHSTLLATVPLAAADGHLAHAWRLGWTLTLILDTRGYWQEYLRTEQVAVRAADQAGDPAGQAHAYHGLGRALSCLGRDEEAGEALDLAYRFYGRTDDRAGMGNIRLATSFLHDVRGDAHAALRDSQQALELFRAAGHRSGAAISQCNIAMAWGLLGAHREALAAAREGLALHEELGDIRGTAASWHSVGIALHGLGETGAALDAYHKGLALSRQGEDAHQQAAALELIGDLRAAAGDTAGAHDVWWEAVTLLDRIGHPQATTVRTKLHGG